MDLKNDEVKLKDVESGTDQNLNLAPETNSAISMFFVAFINM